MLELQSISKQLGSLAISDVSLKIDDGEYFILLGPSGAGKTVLIEIIAGLIKPDKGRILWNNKDITFTAPEARGFAVVYQDYALFPHLTVEQNTVYGLRAARLCPNEIRERLSVLVEILHIKELLNRYPEKLSGGEQQRVALARALAIEPELLLLDEPLSALDTNIRLDLQKQLKRVNRELNVPVLHITHDTEEAMTLGDNVCIMLDNRIRQIATPEQLFRRPSDPEVAKFLGTRNVMPVSEVRDNICLVYGEKVHVSAAEDSTSHIWIKPEEILLSEKPFRSSARNQFKCRIVEWSHCNSLLAVQVASGELSLTALITYASFEELRIEVGTELYATFKSSAVHCF